MHTSRFFLALGAISAFLAVALGAFAAHGLEPLLSHGSLQTFQTGVEYQFLHAFGLMIISILLQRGENKFLVWAGWAFAIGTLLFSCSLYILAVTNAGRFGIITPFGGVSFMIGWGLLAWYAFRQD